MPPDVAASPSAPKGFRKARVTATLLLQFHLSEDAQSLERRNFLTYISNSECYSKVTLVLSGFVDGFKLLYQLHTWRRLRAVPLLSCILCTSRDNTWGKRDLQNYQDATVNKPNYWMIAVSSISPKYYNTTMEDAPVWISVLSDSSAGGCWGYSMQQHDDLGKMRSIADGTLRCGVLCVECPLREVA